MVWHYLAATCPREVDWAPHKTKRSCLPCVFGGVLSGLYGIGMLMVSLGSGGVSGHTPCLIFCLNSKHLLFPLAGCWVVLWMGNIRGVVSVLHEASVRACCITHNEIQALPQLR